MCSQLSSSNCCVSRRSQVAKQGACSTTVVAWTALLRQIATKQGHLYRRTDSMAEKHGCLRGSASCSDDAGTAHANNMHSTGVVYIQVQACHDHDHGHGKARMSHSSRSRECKLATERKHEDYLGIQPAAFPTEHCRLWYAGYCCKAAYCTKQVRCIVAKHELHPQTKQVERIGCSKPCRRSKDIIRSEEQRCIKVHDPGWCYSEYQEAGTIMASSTSDHMALPRLWNWLLLLPRRAPRLQPRSRCVSEGNCVSVTRRWKVSPPITWPAAERCCDASFMLVGSLWETRPRQHTLTCLQLHPFPPSGSPRVLPE
jgi:hypothetical protein